MKLSKTCRTCLHQITQDIIPISISLFDFLERMQINRVPRSHPRLELPQNVCFDCYRHLIAFKRFYTQCRDAEEFLQMKLEDGLRKASAEDNKKNAEDPEVDSHTGGIEKSDDFDETDKKFQDLEVLDENETIEETNDSTVFQLDTSEFENLEDNEFYGSDNSLHGFIIFSLDDGNEKAISNNDSGIKEENSVKKRRRFQCSICEKRFSSRYDLQTHEYIHSGMKPFSCEVCGKCFRQKNVLRTHQALHFGKTIKCEECGKTFARKSQLILHDRMHRNLKPFKCDYDMCTDAFRERQHLLAHQKIHIGVRDHQCELCASAFYHRKGLLSHLRDVHGDVSYQCSYCPRTFNKPYKLRKHMHSLHDVLLSDVSAFKTALSRNNSRLDNINM